MGRAAFGATLSFPRVPAKVLSPSDLPTLEGCARRLESISQGRGRQDRIAEPKVRIQFPPAPSHATIGSGAPRLFCKRYRRFESISLQQAVRLSREVARRGREPRLFAG